MTALDASPGPAKAALFLRFCVVGAVGFLVDAGILTLLVRLGSDPIWARLVSVVIAVATTFDLNRRWAFRHRRDVSVPKLFAGYLAVQGLGFACNFAAYALLYRLLPPPWNHPVLCLAVASGLALLVNFTGVRLAVFRKRSV